MKDAIFRAEIAQHLKSERQKKGLSLDNFIWWLLNPVNSRCTNHGITGRRFDGGLYVARQKSYRTGTNRIYFGR